MQSKMLNNINLRQKFTKILDFIYPHQCPCCKKILTDRGKFCQNCWKEIKIISKPHCEICHNPLEYVSSMSKNTEKNSNKNIICVKCLSKKPIFTKSRSVFAYNYYAAKLIFGLKYYDKMHIAGFCAEYMKNLIEDFDSPDFFVPVPLHKKRLLKRKYNQATLLCNELSKITNIPSQIDLLQRIKHTRPQVELKGKARTQNIKKAIVINPNYLDNSKDTSQLIPELYGKNAVIVDDVMTTGATIKECAKPLLKAGVKNIYVLTVARTVRNV